MHFLPNQRWKNLRDGWFQWTYKIELSGEIRPSAEPVDSDSSYEHDEI